MKNIELLKIHLGDQTDGKSLLGTYVCTDIPGEFKWQPGVLTRSVTEGLWIMIEDIDLAPMDVISIIIPLLEKRELFIPGRGEKIKAAPGFQLFATRTSSSRNSNFTDIGNNLWTKVQMEPLTNEELVFILSELYPNLSNAVSKIMEIYQNAQKVSSSVSHSRQLSSRDILKFCDRIHRYFPSSSVALSMETVDSIFFEALYIKLKKQ